MTMRFRGGGHKRKLRLIDFKRDKVGIPATVISIEYDPNRSARIALVQYEDGEKRYILHPKGLKVGDVIASGPATDVRLGNALPLGEIPLGTAVHNVAFSTDNQIKSDAEANARIEKKLPRRAGDDERQRKRIEIDRAENALAANLLIEQDRQCQAQRETKDDIEPAEDADIDNGGVPA